MSSDGCNKEDAWKAQEKTNDRFDEAFRDIKVHLENIISQGEKIISMKDTQVRQEKEIEVLFKLYRESEKEITKKVDKIPWHKQLPAVMSVVAVMVSIAAIVIMIV